MRMTIFSPNAVGIVEMRSSISSPSGVTRLDAAILRAPLLDDLHAREQLDARRHGIQHRRRNRVDLVQHAVDAEAHETDVAPRLDVDVRRALLERVLPQPVDDVDDVLVVRVEMAVPAELDQLLEVARQREVAVRILLRALHRAREIEELADVAPDVGRIREARAESRASGCCSSSSAQARTNGSPVATVSVLRSTATGRMR